VPTYPTSLPKTPHRNFHLLPFFSLSPLYNYLGSPPHYSSATPIRYLENAGSVGPAAYPSYSHGRSICSSFSSFLFLFSVPFVPFSHTYSKHTLICYPVGFCGLIWSQSTIAPRADFCVLSLLGLILLFFSFFLSVFFSFRDFCSDISCFSALLVLSTRFQDSNSPATTTIVSIRYSSSSSNFTIPFHLYASVC